MMSRRRYNHLNCLRSKWAIRCVTLIMWLLVSFVLLFRVLVWHRKNNIEDHMELVTKSWRNQSSTTFDNVPYLPITLCNINPVRGFKIFTLPNGSTRYDSLSLNWQDSSRNGESLGSLSWDTIENSSHQIKDMLLRCLLSAARCSSDDFHSVWMDQRICHQIIISKTDTSLVLALDPEEQHYLVPGQGFIGFTVHVDNIRTRDNEEPHRETMHVSGGLHSMVKILRSTAENVETCSPSLHEACMHNCSPTTLADCKCQEKLKHCHFSYHLLSNYQSTQSSFFQRLSLIQRQKHPSHLCLDILADLIQKRCLIRLIDQSLFKDLQSLADLLRHINSTQRKVATQRTSIQTQIISDISRLELIQDDSGLCDLPSLLMQLNSSLEFLRNLPRNVTINIDECRNDTVPNSNYELLIVRMMFTSSSTLLKGPNLSNNVNVLTMLNVKYRDRFFSTTSCRNDVVRTIGALYSRLINDFVSLFLDYSHAHNTFFSRLKTTLEKYASVISSLRKQNSNHYQMNLVTLSIEISTGPHRIVAERHVYKSQVYPVYAISDLVDIICSNIAVAALLVLLVKYFSNQCKPRRSSARNVHRRDGATDTEDILDARNSGNIEQITFSL